MYNVCLTLVFGCYSMCCYGFGILLLFLTVRPDLWRCLKGFVTAMKKWVISFQSFTNVVISPSTGAQPSLLAFTRFNTNICMFWLFSYGNTYILSILITAHLWVKTHESIFQFLALSCCHGLERRAQRHLILAGIPCHSPLTICLMAVGGNQSAQRKPKLKKRSGYYPITSQMIY